jgi:hypothetical protein
MGLSGSVTAVPIKPVPVQQHKIMHMLILARIHPAAVYRDLI